MGGRPLLLLLSAAALLLSSFSTALNGGGAGSLPEWQVLTKHNFSSQIRLHPHILLIITVPWSGESRSLMKEVARHVAEKQEELGHLRLMVVFRNSEKLLADVIGAAERVTLFYYHYSTPYKYQGRFRVQNLLSSVHFLASANAEEVPLKLLRTKDDLESFFQSTDKAVLLLEFCGWSAKLLHAKKNESRYIIPSGESFSEKDGIVKEDLSRDLDEAHRYDKKTPKVLENEELTCGVDNGFAMSSWLGGLTWANESDSQEFENRYAETKMSCTPEEYKRFQSFFLTLTTIGREFLLPPERQRFGLISERSLLPFIGVTKPDSWLLMLQFYGCSNCSFIFQEGDDLRTVLQMQHPLVTELDTDGQSLELAFPTKKPSIVLFIDRSSESPEVRGQSKSSLEAFRRFAQSNQLSDMLIKGLDTSTSAGSLAEALFANRRKIIPRTSRRMPANVSPGPNIVKTKDNMAIMIINEGNNISLDSLASNPVYDILARLLQQKSSALKTKETKISSLAKEVGFQLLSDDFELEVVDSSPTLNKNDQSSVTNKVTDESPENQSNTLSEKTNDVNAEQQNLLEAVGAMDVDKGNHHEIIHEQTVSHQNQEANSYSQDSTKMLATMLYQKVKNEMSIIKSAQIDEDDRISDKEGLGSSGSLADNSFVQEPLIVEEYIESDHVDLLDFRLNSVSSVEAGQKLTFDSSNLATLGDDTIEVIDEPQIQHQSFPGSFFYSDGGYRLLELMTASSKIPSLVIIDPVSQKHYVFSEDTAVSYSSLLNFVSDFQNGSLTPYWRSDLHMTSQRETPRPPFVNLDFHEFDSIPRITSNTLFELVGRFKQCAVQNEVLSSNNRAYGPSCNMDVLVLFSTSWCGFCQRMELIVREVYRSLRGYVDMLKSEARNKDYMHTQDDIDDSRRSRTPSIFLIDCTLNDCNLVLQKMGKKEQYPTLLLFPAKSKEAITYEGDLSVVSIIKFITSHGSNSRDLNSHEGFLWARKPKGSTRRDTFSDASLLSVEEQTHVSDKHNEFLLQTPTRGVKKHPAGSHSSDTSHETAQYVVAGSILSATDKLILSSPFHNTTILIVEAEESRGFIGVILNKRINWDVFKISNKEMEPLKQAPLFFGGPVMEHSLPLVTLARKAVDGYTEVFTGFYFGGSGATSLTIEAIKFGRQSANDYVFFLGYSSWGWNQLFEELALGVWHLSSSSVGHLDWPDN